MEVTRARLNAALHERTRRGPSRRFQRYTGRPLVCLVEPTRPPVGSARLS